MLSKRKLAEVAVYTPVCSRCCSNKHPTADSCRNMLESRGIGAGSSPIGCEKVSWRQEKFKAAPFCFQMLIILLDTHRCLSLKAKTNQDYIIIYIYIYNCDSLCMSKRKSITYPMLKRLTQSPRKTPGSYRRQNQQDNVFFKAFFDLQSVPNPHWSWFDVFWCQI